MNITSLLIDIDGVLYVGDTAITGANDALGYLREKGYRFRFVSNTTRKSRKSISTYLMGMGIVIPESMIFTPLLAAADYMKSRGRTRCHLLGTPDIAAELRSQGITLDSGDVDYVVVGDAGDAFSYEQMNGAFRLLLEGAMLLALEKDRYWMGQGGLQLSAGPFVTALEYASGKSAQVIGKPAPQFFSLALDSMDALPGESAMIGDDITTDIGGAMALGMKGILVRTGKFRPEAIAGAGIKPTHVIDSIAAIREIF
ncbi:MAG: TIGR01458 family HAD-type hydrolase [Methanoregulaceae archaeon]|nr:TIGR01458 family HAD-type hydrolase [Methanoregulaceae archaeon]